MGEKHSIRTRQGQIAAAAWSLLALAILIGGASREHALRLALLQLAALPVLALTLPKLHDIGAWSRHRLALGIAAGLLTIPLLQLIPLPPQIWTALPGREQAVLALEIIGVTPGWGTISLTPDQTWRAWLSLLPALALFAAGLTMNNAEVRTAVWLLLALCVASILLGIVQVVTGELYPWSGSDRGYASGFFANRNHLATLCLIALPLAAALAAGRSREGSDGRLALWAGAFFVLLAVVALGAIRSRAGVVLMVPVLVLTGLCTWVSLGKGGRGPAFVALAAGAAAALTLVAVLGATPIMARFDADSTTDVRIERWPIVADAAQAHLPIGAGLGSFDPVFRSVEPPDELGPTYFNRAHNEYLESWLETGWFGAAILVAFLVWFGRRVWTVWRGGGGGHADLARAASVGIGVILAHSVADYPLRTVTVMTTLALLCVLLERGTVERGSSRSSRRGRRRRSSSDSGRQSA
ncbi:MAG: O-antigen ligase family protein [Alphaproteobacteria bacterium]|nr:O-antigen ligase family protein [Alphaproteobacteria bacterium]MBU1525467.1 O-antigen ligase family protein [Alphaproteobacteria bacterium]MBU2350869.1 O-antigen ligase family protein [Alphaproteobacteria bacterium]MBU2381750.1 O-antigen ligase family protein [Alphaproteobacteria bacterium]